MTTTRTSFTIGHNCAGRPINFGKIGPNSTADFLYDGRGGTSPYRADEPGIRAFIHELDRYGHAIVTDNGPIRSSNHYIIGVGVGHDDAAWCESRFVEGSMAAYLENGDAFRGDRKIAGITELTRRSAR